MQKAMLACIHNTCSYVKLPFTGPSILTVDIMKNIEVHQLLYSGMQWMIPFLLFIQ